MAPSATRPPIALPAILAALAMLGPFSIDTAFPAFAQMRSDFGVGAGQMQLVVSAYLLAFAAMSLFHGPISDAVGRRWVMLVGVGVYTAASIGCALAPNLSALLAFRALQGLSAGGGVIVSRTIVRDLYSGAQAQRLMSTVAMIFGLGPAIAPIVGGLILQVASWHAIFWFLAAFGVLLLIAVGFGLPETHPPERRTPFRPAPMLRDLVSVARHARFQQVAWASALTFSGQFLYIGAAAIFIVDLLHRGETDFWIFFVPMVAGVIIGSWVSGRAAGRLSGRRLISIGFAVTLAAAALNVLLAATPATQRLPYAVVGPSLMAFGIATAFPTLQLTALDLFPQRRGTAASVMTFIALTVNGVLASALAPLVTGSLLTLASAALGLVLAGLLAWARYLRSSQPVTEPPTVPQTLEPTDQM